MVGEEKKRQSKKVAQSGEEARASVRGSYVLVYLKGGHVAITCIFMQPHARDRANIVTDSETCIGLITGIAKIAPNVAVTQHDNLIPY